MAASVDNARRWSVLYQHLCGEREGILLTELEALISPVGGQLAGALCAQLRALAPAAEVTLECFLAAVSSAVMSCTSHGCVGAEVLTGYSSSSVRAENMRALLVEWGVLVEGSQEEVGAGSRQSIHPVHQFTRLSHNLHTHPCSCRASTTRQRQDLNQSCQRFV